MASTKTSGIVSMIDRSRNNASSLFKDVSFYLVDETKDEVSGLFQKYLDGLLEISKGRRYFRYVPLQELERLPQQLIYHSIALIE